MGAGFCLGVRNASFHDTTLLDSGDAGWRSTDSHWADLRFLPYGCPCRYSPVLDERNLHQNLHKPTQAQQYDPQWTVRSLRVTGQRRKAKGERKENCFAVHCNDRGLHLRFIFLLSLGANGGHGGSRALQHIAKDNGHDCDKHNFFPVSNRAVQPSFMHVHETRLSERFENLFQPIAWSLFNHVRHRQGHKGLDGIRFVRHIPHKKKQRFAYDCNRFNEPDFSFSIRGRRCVQTKTKRFSVSVHINNKYVCSSDNINPDYTPSCFKSVKVGCLIVYWKENFEQRVDNVCSVEPKQGTRTATWQRTLLRHRC